jgi:List-Bact-rpt repeat protein
MQTVRVTAGGPGRVVSEPKRLDCGTAAARCTGRFPQGTTVRLTGLADADGAFEGWGGPVFGGCAGSVAPACDVVVGSDVDAFAAFRHSAPNPGPQTLHVTPRGEAHVVSSPTGINCPKRCSASFAAIPMTLSSAESASWSGACAGVGPECGLVVDKTTRVTAHVAPDPAEPAFRLNVSVSGPGLVSGGLTIRRTKIRCGLTTGSLLDCEALFFSHWKMTLTAVPRRNSHFGRWRGYCRGKKRRCTLRVTYPTTTTVLAYFRH